MTKNEALQDLKNTLHVSHSQIFTYLNCSLKYRFMYVEARPQERVSIALPFGKSIHASLERQYRVMKESRRWEPLGVLLNYFEHHINLELAQKDIPIVFKQETPDRDAVIDMGIAMLEAFHESVDLNGFEILEIERPFAKLASAVLAGIENKVFIPQPSWMCADCPYQDACRSW